MEDATLLSPEAHSDLRRRSPYRYLHAKEMAFCPVMPGELDHVFANFPVVFVKDAETGAFSCVALFSLDEKENLFVAKDGAWMATYAPEALRVYPFSVGTTDGENGSVCFIDDPDYCSYSVGEKVFDDSGKPTLFLETINRQLAILVAGERQIAGHIAQLVEHRVLTELAVVTKRKSGKSNRLQGIYTTDRNALTTLDDSTVVELHRSGALAFAFGCGASIVHITNLVQRKNLGAEDPIVSVDAAESTTQ